MYHFSNSNAWVNAYAATLIISLIPNLILFLIPSKVLISDVKAKFNFQNISLSFAAGGLLGDVFLHILPDLFFKDAGHHDHHDSHEHHEHNHEHNHECNHHDHTITTWFQSFLKEHHSLYIGLLILAGFLIFIAIEKFVALNSSHDHSHDHPPEPSVTVIGEKAKNTPRKSAVRRRSKAPEMPASPSPVPVPVSTPAAMPAPVVVTSTLSSSVLINLLADSMHNLTDGLALGASYARGQHGLALATLLSVLFHEIPHEVGDMAVLMKNGYTKWQAIRAQFVTAVAAFFGTSLGLFFQKNEVVEEVLLALTCGGFLFVAAVNLIPPVLADKHVGPWQVLLELLGFLSGVGLMVGVVFLEEGEGHSHSH